MAGWYSRFFKRNVVTNGFKEIDFQILNFSKMYHQQKGRLPILSLSQLSFYHLTKARCTHQQSPTLLWNTEHSTRLNLKYQCNEKQKQKILAQVLRKMNDSNQWATNPSANQMAFNSLLSKNGERNWSRRQRHH